MSDNATVTQGNGAKAPQADTQNIRIGIASYEILRDLAHGRRTSIREEADRLIQAGLKRAEKGR